MQQRSEGVSARQNSLTQLFRYNTSQACVKNQIKQAFTLQRTTPYQVSWLMQLLHTILTYTHFYILGLVYWFIYNKHSYNQFKNLFLSELIPYITNVILTSG